MKWSTMLIPTCFLLHEAVYLQPCLASVDGICHIHQQTTYLLQEKCSLKINVDGRNPGDSCEQILKLWEIRIVPFNHKICKNMWLRIQLELSNGAKVT